MNISIRKIIENFSYTLLSNFISLAISSLVVIIVPKLIGVEEYGYWQLYLFYVSYVGFMHFGWTDGIYLREGGKDYHLLEYNKLFSQFYMLLFLQTLIGIAVIIFGINFLYNSDRLFIVIATSICMVLTNLRSFTFFLLQATNRIKDFARANILGQSIYFTTIIIMLLFGVRDFKMLILADLAGRFISLTYSVYMCKEIVFRPLRNFKFSISEAFKNISVGSKLMFSYIASLMIIGVIRFGIERAWDVSTFGKVSLTLSISKLVMLFISSISIILFPILRKTSIEKLPTIYMGIRQILMILLLGVMAIYYPFKIVMSHWLPNYQDSLEYMALLFPMIVFEGKTSLLINTFLKTLREEKILLMINIISLLMSLLFAVLTTVFLKNLELSILSIVVVLAIRSTIAELYIKNILNISIVRYVIAEIIMSIVFIFVSWTVEGSFAFLIYLTVFLVYVFINRKNLFQSLSLFKTMSNS